MKAFVHPNFFSTLFFQTVLLLHFHVARGGFGLKDPIAYCCSFTNFFLDVKGINFVINYDYPSNSEDYVHRIGRTGRAGAKGTAVTLFTQDNSKQARDLLTILTEAKQYIDPKLQEMGRFRGGNGGGRGYGGGRGRGGRGYGGGRGGYRSGGSSYTGSNNAPLGRR